MCVLQAAFEVAAQGGVNSGSQASSGPAPEQGGQETVAERTTLADAALGVATQVVAGVRDGSAGMVSSVREMVGRCASDADQLQCGLLAMYLAC